jgi:hypothetical protein
VVTSMPHRRCGFLDRTDEALDFGRPDLVVETITFALHNDASPPASRRTKSAPRSPKPPTRVTSPQPAGVRTIATVFRSDGHEPSNWRSS